jgi:hypothetical protein
MFTYFMDNFTDDAFSIVRHKMYSKVPNAPLQMKEDVMVSQVGEEFGGLFNELSSLDNVNEESDGSGVMLSKAVVNILGVLDIETSRLNKSLIFYFFNDSEIVRGCCGYRGGSNTT